MTPHQLRYLIAVEKHASFNKAAKSLYISQPSISALVRDLENELGITIFKRTKKGIALTAEGQELLKYAHQLVDLEDSVIKHFQDKKEEKKVSFSISSQHYSFVLHLFSKLVTLADINQYELRLKETTTSKVIEDVAQQRSELGMIFISQYSDSHIGKILKKNNLMFTPLITLPPHVYLHKNHPLAGKEHVITEDLTPFPCIIFDQDNDLPLYFSEEITIPDHNPSKVLYISDLFTSMMLMEKCSAYNIGTGLFPDEKHSVYADLFVSIPILDQPLMTVGWISLNNTKRSPLGEKFITLLQDYKEKRS